MFEDEVNYRLAKWILLNMEKDKLLTATEAHRAWEKIAEHYNPPFLEVEDFSCQIGDGVKVDER